MADTAYKRTGKRDTFIKAASLALSSPSELRRPPAVDMAFAQDSALAGRRCLASRHTGGSQEFLVDNTSSGGGSQGKPDQDTWRRVARFWVEQQPATSIVARFLAAPSGASEYQSAGGPWQILGIGGETRVRFDWTDPTATYTDSQEVVFTPINEIDADGAEQAGDGAQWAQLEHFVATGIAPTDALSLAAEASKWSEWPTLELNFEDRGGARILHVSVGELPEDHTVPDTAAEVTLTGSKSTWETNRPQIEAPAGATFEEHRYGSYRSMETAARQTERVGPVVAQWSAYDERSATVTQTDPPGRTRSLSTFARISMGTNTAWDAEAVGFDIVGTQRAPEHLFTRISGAGSIPVLIRVEARFTAGGSAVAAARFASSPRGWVDVELDQAVIGTNWTTVKGRGCLEANIATDDGYAIIQDFFRSDDAQTVEIRFWSISYGDYPTGA